MHVLLVQSALHTCELHTDTHTGLTITSELSWILLPMEGAVPGASSPWIWRDTCIYWLADSFIL